MKKLQYFLSGIMVMLLLISAVSLTIAWIEQDNSPELNSNLRLASSPGLIMRLDQNVMDVIDINHAVMGDSGDFTLSEASSCDGTFQNLFIREPGEPADKIFVHQALTSEKNQKFIFFTISLTSAEDNMAVWFDSSSLISLVSYNAANSPNVLRVSFTLEDTDGTSLTAANGEHTTIFANYVDTDNPTYALVDYSRVDNMVPEMSDLDPALLPSYYGIQNVHLFSEYTESNPWLVLNHGQIIKVHVMVWLEGCDVNCVDTDYSNTVSGSRLKLEVLLDSAPVTTTPTPAPTP